MNNFSDFGQLELYEASELFILYAEELFSEIAEDNFGTISSIGFDYQSNVVYLQDEDYHRVAINHGVLDLYIITPSGEEGFMDHFLEQVSTLSQEDIEYLLETYSKSLSTEEITKLRDA